MEVESNIFSPSGLPYYLFTFVDDCLQPPLAALLREELGIPDRLPPPFQHFRAQAVQFAVGREDSGSPAHFHDDAFNILLTGRKHWWLWPPAQAAMSRVHPKRLAQVAPDAERSALKVVQEPGDVLYVPSGWGHAVLNATPHTVCVAVEFGL